MISGAATTTEPAPGKAFTAGTARALLALIVLLYLALGLTFAHLVPAWQAPDEPAHYNYVKYLADYAQLPILERGDYPSAGPPGPRAVLTNIAAYRYESHQPPLYYAIGAVVYKAGGRLFALRALSVLFGAALLVLVAWSALLVFPGWFAGAVAAAAFVAFLPMHLFMTASVDNDTLSELVLSALLLLFLAVAGGRTFRGLWIVLGVLCAAALLTKVTIYLPAGLLALATLAAGCRASYANSPEKAARRTPGWPRRATRALGITAAVTLAGAGWWFVRNGLIYGWTDLAAQTRQAEVAGSQLHQGALGWGMLGRFLVTCFHSFWGQFGWMSVPLSGTTYRALEALSAGLAAGLLLMACRAWRARAQNERPSPAAPHLAWQAGGLIATWLGVAAGLVYYNLTFVQEQGRYLFPALVPIALAASLGVAGWFPRRLQPAALALAAAGSFAFALFALRYTVLPAFAL
ncbi:MAG: DUF2142 domain-containing protein [Chloroflexota bacterium]